MFLLFLATLDNGYFLHRFALCFAVNTNASDKFSPMYMRPLQLNSVPVMSKVSTFLTATFPASIWPATYQRVVQTELLPYSARQGAASSDRPMNESRDYEW